jgi:phosphoribosylformylglycinamidine cyclo-ligase
MPSVMDLFGALGGLDDVELRATFNGGLGMIVVVAPEAVDTAREALAAMGHPAALVGTVVEAARLGDGRDARYAEVQPGTTR